MLRPETLHQFENRYKQIKSPVGRASRLSCQFQRTGIVGLFCQFSPTRSPRIAALQDPCMQGYGVTAYIALRK
ncbi:MAG: hypothetical protein F6J93_29855 [Oscillatoria sp. SIO1A7]|nr:hypothetical protein [Oscillatoria sp. SIO1A7]